MNSLLKKPGGLAIEITTMFVIIWFLKLNLICFAFSAFGLLSGVFGIAIPGSSIGNSELVLMVKMVHSTSS